jgi:hypothetical protein
MKRLSIVKKLAGLARSRLGFIAVVCLFLLESGWLAVSSNYPMAFDEDFHLGIIKLYARQWGPFFSQQPVGANAYGAVTRDPSYLYHYLMSFPYRLITLFTSDQTIQVIALRFIDIGLFTVGLVLFRVILRRCNVSEALSNVVLLFFILVPVVPLLAAQINYDDLLVPLVALSLLLTLQFIASLEAGSVAIGKLISLVAVCALASLVQFEFLPIFAAIGLLIGYRLARRGKQATSSWSLMRRSWHYTRQARRFGYIALLIVSMGLFGERYGLNLAAYKTPLPQCNQVLSVTQCTAYTPWYRNYTDAQNKTTVDINPLRYSANWFYGMFEHSFFTTSGGGDSAANYINIAPLPIISVTAIAVAGGGLVLLLVYRRTIFEQYPAVKILLFVSIVYCLSLWLWNYHDFVNLGAAVALNGRYLFPVLPFLMVAGGLAYRQFLGDRRRVKIALFGVVLVLLLQGGGALSFIYASNAHWYWTNNHAVDTLNRQAQRVVRPLIIS